METGVVIKSTGSWYTVKTGSEKTVNCKIRGNLKIRGIRSTNPVAAGDIVFFDFDEKTNTGIITEIQERKNYIIRRSSNLSKESHIIAANLDQALLIVTLAFPRTSTAFIDRFLVTAEAYRIPVIIAFNKIDLYNDEMLDELKRLKDIYTSIGYQCVEMSVLNNTNISMVKLLLQNKVTLLSGHSGVGKSLLINTIEPSVKQKTNEISDYHQKGKHTTTFAEMFEITGGGSVIDTPGIKGFGLLDFEKEEIYHFFPEMFRVAKDCQYYNCIHTHEPGCAVKKAVEEGTVSIDRYENYLSLLYNDDNKYR